MSMRRLSMSATCRCRSSAFRMPVEYRTISIVRCDRLSAASITRATSSTLKIWGQPPRGFGIRRFVEQVPPLQRLHEEETQRRHVEANGQRPHLLLVEQIRLVRPEMRLIQPVGPALEVSSELLDRVEIRRDRGGGEVTALELLQHHLPTMGHKTTPSTPPLPPT